jgi:hypothetical protein
MFRAFKKYALWLFPKPSPADESPPRSPIPWGHSTHDYVGGSTLYKLVSPQEIRNRRIRVEKLLAAYR